MRGRWNVRVLAVLAMASVGCFKHPGVDPSTLRCATDENCPSGWVCSGASAGVLGTCARTRGDGNDAGIADAATDLAVEAGHGTDGAAEKPASLDSAIDQSSVDSVAGKPDVASETGSLDLRGSDDVGDVPITGTGGVGGNGGAGGSVGTGGSTGTTVLDAGSTGGITGSGGVGTGGVRTGGTSGAGTGGAAGGATGTGGSGSGGFTGTGGIGTGGTPGTGGIIGTGGVIGTGGTTAPAGCVPTKAWTTANPAAMGPFTVVADKNVGPLAGALPDPIYGDTQQRFNVYRPTDISQGYCHPILLWGNGHGDNPEPNPPFCVVDSASNQWCGQYLPVMNLLASHGFVVVASLSTSVSKADPGTGLLPQLVGMNWLIQQNEDSTSPYYHRLDTAHIGALGHSEGGMATSKVGADPHVVTTAMIAGTTAPPTWLGPALLMCGGKDTVVGCSGTVQSAFNGVTTTPVMLEDNPNADHGSWIFGGTSDPFQTAVTAWMRVHLMGDSALRTMFYGTTCGLCQDAGLQVQRKNMSQ